MARGPSHKWKLLSPDHGGTCQTALRPSPQKLAGDTVYGAVRLLKWLVDRNIRPHVPVWDKSARPDSASCGSTDFDCGA